MGFGSVAAGWGGQGSAELVVRCMQRQLRMAGARGLAVRGRNCAFRSVHTLETVKCGSREKRSGGAWSPPRSLRRPLAACRPRCSPTRRPQRPLAGSHAGPAGLCRLRPALGGWMGWAANKDDTWSWPGRCEGVGWQRALLGQSRTDGCCSHRRCCRCRNQSNLWTPTSQRGVEFPNRAGPESLIYAGQGPPPPSPMVVERFQQVISQLFSQVSGGGRGGGWWAPAASGGRRGARQAAGRVQLQALKALLAAKLGP